MSSVNKFLVFLPFKLFSMYDYFPEYPIDPKLRGDGYLISVFNDMRWNHPPSFFMNAHRVLDIGGLSLNGKRLQFDMLSWLLRFRSGGGIGQFIDQADPSDPYLSPYRIF